MCALLSDLFFWTYSSKYSSSFTTEIVKKQRICNICPIDYNTPGHNKVEKLLFAARNAARPADSFINTVPIYDYSLGVSLDLL